MSLGEVAIKQAICHILDEQCACYEHTACYQQNIINSLLALIKTEKGKAVREALKRVKLKKVDNPVDREDAAFQDGYNEAGDDLNAKIDELLEDNNASNQNKAGN